LVEWAQVYATWARKVNHAKNRTIMAVNVMQANVSPAADIAAPGASAWDLTLDGWRALVAAQGAPPYRAGQIWRGLYEQLAERWDDFTVLPRAFRQALAQRLPLDALTPRETRESSDGVRKLLCACRDGELIEAVLIPSAGRFTLCVSSQAGCAFSCAFCASGAAGLARGLSAGEIVGQVVLAARLLRARPATAALGRPHNVVVMGMGEPFANYDAVLQALRVINAPDGLNIGARHITISTCGVVPGIQRLAAEGQQFELAVSLHAPNDAIRDRLMPVNKRWPLQQLLAACRDYTDQTGRIVTFEYTLVAGVNDQPGHARELAARLSGWRCHVNLIPLSPVAGFDGVAPDARVCEAFQRALEEARVPVTLRRSRGGAVDAACGQLRLRRLTETRAAP
jgi:23S rRNA (adenine2503-C2)-methyltransferase